MLWLGCGSAAAIDVDGRLDETAWDQAQRHHDFVVTQPLTLATPRLKTSARFLSLPEGLAIAITSEQPPDSAERRAPARSRDSSPMASDLVYVMVDFDATGIRAYEFMVGRSGAQRDGTWVSENQPSLEWDGRWQSAVHEGESAWTVEMLIPWSVVPMRPQDGDTRTVGVNVGRFVEAHGERYSWPAVSFQQARYVSDFARIELAAHSQQALDIYPYATGTYDLLDAGAAGKGGVDIFWKPGGRFQLNAALNPDFGQVESDDLVVNFDAIETFFTDKRPFFTENQTLFNLQTPQGGELIYTRRVGAASDDGSGDAADIDAAIKLSASAGAWDLGAFAASEAEDAGRDFLAVRALRPADGFQFGYLGTLTERPELDRRAAVNAADWRWTLGPDTRVEGMLIHSDVRQGGQHTRGGGTWASLKHAPGESWEHEVTLTHLDRNLDFNDFGFLPRNSLNQAYLYSQRRDVDHAPGSRNTAVVWAGTASWRANDSGDVLQGFYYLSRSAEREGGGGIYSELRYDPPGNDDLISRGNGIVRRSSRLDFWHYYQSPQLGAWKYYLGGWSLQEGLGGRAFQFESTLSYQLSQTLSLSGSWTPRWSDDWLVWRENTLLARYERRQVDARLEATWFPATRHELRLKAQWLVIDADRARAVRIGPGGRLEPSTDMIPDLTVANFGLQLRYRYEIAPQRELYVVYGRGGFELEEDHGRGVGSLFGDATRLRDSDQLLVKLRWRL
jgi:hypothetical protein